MISPFGKDVGGAEDFVIAADISGGAPASASASFGARRGNLILDAHAPGRLGRPCTGAVLCDRFERDSVQGELASVEYAGVAHARVAFAMKVGAPDRQIALMRLQLTETDRSEVFDLFMLPGKIVANEQGFGAANAGTYDYAVQAGFTPDVWQRWTLELDGTVSPAMGIVTLDGKEVIRTPLHNAYRKSAFNVLLGAFYAPNGPPHDVSFDDVAITILP